MSNDELAGKPMKQAVIFDIDGTLLDSSADDDRIYRDAVRTVLGDVEMRPSLHDYDPVTDTGILTQIFADNALALDDVLMHKVKEEFFVRLEDFVENHGPFAKIPGAREVLARLQVSDRHEIAIATGGWRRSARIKLTSAGFEIDTVPLASSDDAMRRDEIMLVALQALPGEFSSITYFGDGQWDAAACETLGWDFRAVGPALDGLRSFDGLYVD